jgi:hypothetical protein
MKWFAIVEKNTRASALVKKAFESLTWDLEGRLAQIAGKQEDYLSNRPDIGRVLIEKCHVRTDLLGRNFTEYRSSIAQIRICFDNPIGWIYGEVERLAPPMGQIKSFAVTVNYSRSRDHKIVCLGCYETEKQLGYGDMLSHLEESMAMDLTLGTIEPDHLRLTTSRSPSLIDRNPRPPLKVTNLRNTDKGMILEEDPLEDDEFDDDVEIDDGGLVNER